MGFKDTDSAKGVLQGSTKGVLQVSTKGVLQVSTKGPAEGRYAKRPCKAPSSDLVKTPSSAPS